MSAPFPPARPAFPDRDVYAHAFFSEAIRHLEDASVLHHAGRYAGAITSALKGAELGIKAALILEGAMGWWDRLQQTHKPLEEIRGHPVLKHHFDMLEQQQPLLTVKVVAMEKLAPARPDAKSFSFETQANTEYPFFYLQAEPATRVDTAHLARPSEYFSQSDSLSYLRAVHELLTAYQTLIPAIAAWGCSVPPPV